MRLEATKQPTRAGTAAARHLLGRLIQLIAAVVVALAGAEVTSRIIDIVRYGTPLLGTPELRRDLIVTDSFGTHGRPFGRYKGYRLNGAGFRGPDAAPYPPPGCVRIVVLGASETFGSPDEPTYPELLADSLRRDGCYEVLNAAVVGLVLPGILRLWDGWAWRFHPHLVIVYPSPAFYLADRTPDFPKPAVTGSRGAGSSPGAPRFDSRFVDKLRDRFEMPGIVQRWRVRRWLGDAVRDRDSTWFFRTPPVDRLDAFQHHLDSLVTLIRARGAEPVLVTHAMRFSDPPRAEDHDLLLAWRRYAPRATEEALLGFERAAADRVREVARSRHVPLIDAAAALNGTPGLFTDFVHFMPEGAGRLAGMLAGQIRGLRRPEGAPRAAARPAAQNW